MTTTLKKVQNVANAWASADTVAKSVKQLPEWKQNYSVGQLTPSTKKNTPTTK